MAGLRPWSISKKLLRWIDRNSIILDAKSDQKKEQLKQFNQREPKIKASVYCSSNGHKSKEYEKTNGNTRTQEDLKDICKHDPLKRNLAIHPFLVLKVNIAPCHFLLDTSPGSPYAAAAY